MNRLATPRFSLKPAHYLFAGVVLLRLFVLARLTASPFLLPSRGDMHFYNDWAHRILQGELTDQLAFYGLPLYPFLLAFFYKICGYNPFIPALLQALLDGGTAVLIYLLARRTLQVDALARLTTSTSRRWNFVLAHEREFIAILAGSGWAFFAPAAAYSVILMPTAWFVFVFWFVVWRIVHRENGPSLAECLLLGLLIGVSAMGVATILFLIPLVLTALFLKSDSNNKSKRHFATAAAIVALVCGIILGTSPSWIHNYFIARDPVFLSAHSGINFWIGNNPLANGYPRFPPGLRAGQAAMLEDSITSAETVAGRTLKRADVSAYWSAKARNYIAHNFQEWLKLLLTKLRNFWNAFQYDDLSIITNLREQRIILPGLLFGIVAAIAIPGMVLGWRLAPRSRWIVFAIVLHMAAVLTVFVTERYRLPVVPGLLIFAVFGLGIFWKRCALGEYRGAAGYVVLIAASTAFVSWPQRDSSLWALDAYNSGWQALESGNLPLAEKKLMLARSYVPTNPETNFALGNLRLAQGQPETASFFYRATLRFDENHRGALNNLGVMALEGGQYDVAELWFRRAENVDPRNAKVHFLLAKTLLAKGERERAKAELERALLLRPNQPEFEQLKQHIESQ